MRRWGRRAEGAVGAEGALPWYSQEELRRATGDWRTRLGEGDSPHTPLPRTIPLPPLFLLPVIPHPRPLPTPITSFPPYPHAPVSPHPLPADKELDPVLMRAVGADGALPRYSQEELRRATGDWRTKLGEGGFGAVYKGLLLLPRIGGDGEGDGGGGGDREGDGEDGEEEGEEGVEEGLEGLEVVEVDGKRFVPVAVKMCLTEGDVHGGREQLLVSLCLPCWCDKPVPPDTFGHSLSLPLPFPSPYPPTPLPLFSDGGHGHDGSLPFSLSPPPPLFSSPTPLLPAFSDREHGDDGSPTVRSDMFLQPAPPHYPLLPTTLSSPLPSPPHYPLLPTTLSSPLPSPPHYPLLPTTLSSLPHQTEIMVMKALHHPNVLRLLGVAMKEQAISTYIGVTFENSRK
ncbi:unnamed protein product [Closterium sp. NIES-53]